MNILFGSPTIIAQYHFAVKTVFKKTRDVTFGKTEKVRNDNEKSRKTAKTVNETVK
jgi:hypothetical protein